MQKRMFSNPSINLITNFVSPPFFFVSESGVGDLLDIGVSVKFPLYS